MQELNDFINDGFGWKCKHCIAEALAEKADPQVSRLLNEGEAESRSVKLSDPLVAKWADPARRYLLCPRCGIRELADKA